MSEYSTAGLTLADLRRIVAEAECRGVPDDVIIVLAKDGEGNAFSPLRDWTDDAVYVPESNCAGSLEYWDEDDVEDLRPDRETYSEWCARAQAEGGFRCVVLWPTN